MPRSFVSVIDAVLAAIPEGADTGLVAALKRERQDAAFAAPESPRPWQRLGSLLSMRIGPPVEPWQQKVSDLVEGREVVS